MPISVKSWNTTGEYVDFEKLYPVPSFYSRSHEVSLKDARVVVFDQSLYGASSATGMIKKLFFSFFKPANLLSLTIDPKGQPCFIREENGSREQCFTARDTQLTDIIERIRKFDPHFLYIRPAGKPLGFFRLQVALCREGFGFRTVLHVMDNWHEKAALEKHPEAAELDSGLKAMARDADVCLGISPSMCGQLRLKTGRPFLWLSTLSRSFYD